MSQALIEIQGLQRVNDFVVKFANVNGSGSASANTLFGKSILRMGVPVAPRNIFPSNIQGLPTWYEVRVSEAGHLGARGGVDLMVAMNPQTWDQDIRSIEPGGYLFYDSTKALPPSKFRDDIVVLGMPLTELTNRAYTDTRQRQLFKNIIYVGALSALLDIDPAVIETLLAEQFRGKDALIAPNVAALHMGRDYALAHLPCPIGLRVRARRRGGRSHLDRRQCRRRAGRGVWRGDRGGVVPDHAVLLARRGVHALLPPLPGRQGDRAEPVRRRAGGGRAGLDRHGDRRRLERGARVHRHLRARASR